MGMIMTGEPRYRLMGPDQTLTVSGDTLHFEGRDDGTSFTALAAEPLPDDNDAFENALIIAVNEIAQRDDVRGDPVILSLVQDVQQLLLDYFEAA
ncbi:hypothetical protein ACOI1H_14625 [Loktanella sp. DJP18]|uniref:hypothetical protein n=1 Tax=Loktanella sp. DJP18 TaxID=3409788 RepID=UPI003BB71E9B